MEEAERFDWLVAMNDGQILATGTPQELLERTDTPNLDAAFIALLPEEQRRGHREIHIPPRAPASDTAIAIEAEHVTVRFGDFTAVDNVSFRIPRGEIFGFLGSNGCGKTTTMKVLTGFLPASEGTARLFGREVDPKDIDIRRHVGYMSQAFSLYSELTARFDLADVMDELPDAMPLGIRQRLSLAVALIHSPDILILDEPTSGVDPVARDAFWQILADLSRRDNVTIFVSTHFMNEVELCDRISLMHAGKVLISDTPKAITESRNAATLEDAFVAFLQDAIGEGEQSAPQKIEKDSAEPKAQHRKAWPSWLPNLRRMFAYTRREALELKRDPIRATLAILGSVILMFVIGYGINLDVEKLTTAGNFNLEIRYRYNPDVQSLVAMVPAVIPLLLLMIPAMLAVLSVVREKELGSIINFYVTPVTKFEFLLGKQLPYIGLAFLNFLMLTAFAVFIFRVPFTGSFVTYATAALLYVIITTSMGLVISAFMNSQIAAIFGTALMTLIPAVQYSGIIDPVSALQGVGAFIGKIYPTTYFVTISRGTFSKALDFSALAGSFLPLLIAIPVLMLLGIVLLKKQAS
ncbi:hypothetical protein C010_01306 [Brucella ovis 80/125]|nr:hypothetical protein C010_01306 [Brucella ovis 80/125]ENS95316.1 hypothetical protein B999_01630 [Brucella ovis 63/96]SUW43878.1 ABC transporter, ATP binding/permease protein [Brucella ovis]